MYDTSNSLALWERSRKVLAGGVSSALRASFKPHPLFFTHGQGPYIFDEDGHRYLDFTLAWGPLIAGHSHPYLLDHVREALSRGQTFGAQHALEVIVAERVQRLVPCADLVAFASTGTEAVQVALRLARAHTGRQRIVKFEGHYHGWSDAMLISYRPGDNEAGPADAPVAAAGSGGQATAVLDDVIVLPWNDLSALQKALESHGSEIAAIIAEPILANTGLIHPGTGYLEAMRELCDQFGIVLIFDEVITGFRVALGGAQSLLGVTPDLATYAKAVAGGFVLSMICGRQHLMEQIADGRVVHAGTYNGNIVSLAAAEATLDLLERPGAYEHLTALGCRAAEGVRLIGRELGVKLLVHQAGPIIYVLVTDQEEVNDYRSFRRCNLTAYREWAAALLERGVLLLQDGRWYFSLSHTLEQVDEALQALRDVINHSMPSDGV